MSVVPGLRRADLKREIDRNQWSAVSDKAWMSAVQGEGGEHLTREIFFGRAFSEPPFLHWDMSIVSDWVIAPELTVGVVNWIIDEYGAYIGARLWLKIPCEVGCSCN